MLRSARTQLLLHAFVDRSTAEQVHREARDFTGGALVQRRQHIVHVTRAHEIGHVVVAEVDAAAAPLDVTTGGE